MEGNNDVLKKRLNKKGTKTITILCWSSEKKRHVTIVENLKEKMRTIVIMEMKRARKAAEQRL